MYQTTYGSITIWDVDTGECICKLTGHLIAVLSLQMLAKSSIVSGSIDAIKIWNVDTGEYIRTLITGDRIDTRSLHLLENNTLAGVSFDEQIQIWNVDTGKFIRTLTDNSD